MLRQLFHRLFSSSREDEFTSDIATHLWFNDAGVPVETKDIILTKNRMLYCDEDNNGVNNMNTITIASVGSGKTRGFVKGNLLNKGSSFVVTDVKGDLVNQFGAFFENEQSSFMPAYKLKILNLKNLSMSLQYNPFKYMHTPLDVEFFAKATIENIKSSSDPYWHQSAECLLKSVIHYMFEQYPQSDWNIKAVLDIFKNLVKTSAPDSSLPLYDVVMNSLADDSRAKSYYKEVDAVGSDKTWSCITSMLGNALQQFENIQDIMGNDELELDMIESERTALFIIVDDSMMSVFGFMISILYTQLFQVLCRSAGQMVDKKLPVRVQFIMDDFANYIIPNISDMISSVRSRNIAMHMILQSESQLIRNYGVSLSHNIIANCCYIYMAGNDFTTISNIASRTGKSVVDIQDMVDKCIITFPEGKTIIDEKFVSDRDHPFYRYLSSATDNYSVEVIADSFWDCDNAGTIVASNLDLLVANSLHKDVTWLDNVMVGLVVRKSKWDSNFEKRVCKLISSFLLSSLEFKIYGLDEFSIEYHVPLKEIFDADQMMSKSQKIGWKLINMHVDMLVRSKSGYPIVGIEIDGADYHSSERQMANDSLKDYLFDRSHIMLCRIKDLDDVTNDWLKALAKYIDTFFTSYFFNSSSDVFDSDSNENVFIFTRNDDIDTLRQFCDAAEISISDPEKSDIDMVTWYISELNSHKWNTWLKKILADFSIFLSLEAHVQSEYCCRVCYLYKQHFFMNVSDYVSFFRSVVSSLSEDVYQLLCVHAEHRFMYPDLSEVLRHYKLTFGIDDSVDYFDENFEDLELDISDDE